MDSVPIYLSNSELRSLRRVKRRAAITRQRAYDLARMRLLKITSEFKLFHWARCELTVLGRRCLDTCNRERTERWWTRGLALAAIIISLLSLTLELQSRGIIPSSHTTTTAPIEDSALPLSGK